MAAKKCDHLIITYHGGKEHYPYPTPNQQKICRFFIELGARLVVCQHSHCAGCWEFYKSGFIVYGQGNFICDKKNRARSWYEGFLVSFVPLMDKKWKVDLIPYLQFYQQPKVLKLFGKEKDIFLNKLKERSQQIQDEKFVKEACEKQCKKEKYTYFSRLYGHNKFFRFINRIVGFSDWIYPTSKKLMIRNVVECETHREVLETLWRLGDF